jgi:hypothetical protein
MKNLLSISFLFLLLFSCKKSDVIVQEDMMKGKLKSMKVNEYSTGRLEQYYTLDYVEGKLSAIELNEKSIIEWLSKPSDSLVFRYHLLDEETGEVTSMDFNIIKDAAGVILSIIGLPNENYEGGDTLFYFNRVENKLELGLFSSNSPLVSGFPGGKSNLYDYQFYDKGFESKIDYSSQNLTSPPYPVGEFTDVIRVEYSQLTSLVAMPSQSYGLVIPLNHYGSYFGNLVYHFLQLSGYHIYQPYTKLPEKVYVNEILKYTIDYQQNGLNQVNKMTYNYLGEKVGEIKFEYY